MPKQVKERVSKKSFYFSIITSIRNHNKLPSLGLSKQAMNYYVQRLKKEGIIKKKGYGVWEYVGGKKEQKEVKKRVYGCHSIRGHNFQFRLSIPQIQNWFRMNDFFKKKAIRDKLDQKKILYQEVGKTWKGHKLLILGQTVILCPKCILIYFKQQESFYSVSDANSCKINAIDQFLSIIQRLEGLLGVSFKMGGQYKFKVFNQHYARVKDSLAKYANESKKVVKCYYDGRCWLLVDKSLNQDEFETVDPKTSDKDQDNLIVPLFNDLKEHFENTGEVITFSKVLIAINEQNKAILNQQEQINSLLYKKPEPLDKRDSYFG